MLAPQAQPFAAGGVGHIGAHERHENLSRGAEKRVQERESGLVFGIEYACDLRSWSWGILAV